MTSPPPASDQPSSAASNTERPFATGPEIGALLPDFMLPDQHGTPVALHEARGTDRAFVVFIRATEW
ncbi:MAG: hypothetical protein O2895_06845 [Chloroflexi bacterium]|nr:hypothetical protein [Chloroflexota bacterium]